MRVFAGAGEASGDRILAALLRGLRAECPQLELCGFGGPLAAREGLSSIFPLERLAVNGVGDVARNTVFLLRAYLRYRAALLRFQPDRVVLVDYPGMNVRLAQLALRRGIPVHYVAPPQLWAYRNPGPRLRRMRKAMGGATLQVLFPFEKESYREWPSPVVAGHFFSAPPAPSATPPLGKGLLLCPGSRAAVLRRNLPLWLRRLGGEPRGWDFNDTEVLVPPGLVGLAQALARKSGVKVTSDPEVAFARAARAIAFPGTVTLELFLRGIPTEVWAVVDPVTLWMGRRALRDSQLALPNVWLGKSGFPEWVGTSRDFLSRPPPISQASQRPVLTRADVATVWEKMGPSFGVRVGVRAILEG